MSSNGGGGGAGGANNGQSLMFVSGQSEPSVSEAISNISSPDYQDEHDLLSARDLSAAMAISDPSDSDSTLIVDQVSKKKEREPPSRLVIPSTESFNTENELSALANESMTTLTASGHYSYENQENRGSSPFDDDGSDVDSLHSFHYSPKAVDMPSAVRLAKRLYTLDGFKKSDVSRHLSKK
jgi:PH and SEC7 domain-containing protein